MSGRFVGVRILSPFGLLLGATMNSPDEKEPITRYKRCLSQPLAGVI